MKQAKHGIVAAAFCLMFVLGVFAVAAQNETSNATATNVSVEDLQKEVGIGPDNFLYGFKLAFENINLALTFNKEDKIQKRLQYADERLAEVQLMVAENKTQEAQRAEDERQKQVNETESDLNDLEAQGGMRADIRAHVLEELQKHVTVLEGVRARLEAKGIDVQGIDNALNESSNVIGRFEQKQVRSENGTSNETQSQGRPGRTEGEGGQPSSNMTNVSPQQASQRPAQAGGRGGY